MGASCKSLIVPGLIDSPLKLQLVLLFYRHPRLCGEARRLTDWLRESPWAIEEALDALVGTNLLARIEPQGRILYRLEPNIALLAQLEWLVICYDDPLQRDEIYALVREADRERQFRADIAEAEQQMLQAVW
jgi:hypothetical protein